MNPRLKALAVHLLTATGAVLSMLALLAAVRGEWSQMFFWLVVALIVDGVDGPLARRYHVKTNWPTYDGVLMDLIIDYLTYVFIPAYALFMSGLLPGWTGWIAIIAITYGSVIYFADTRMKTRDNSFAGFPACWNMVVLVLFAIKPDFWLTLAVVVALAIAMFTNLKFIHPVRTERWRLVSLPVTAAWVGFSVWAVLVDFHPESFARWGLLLSSLWLMFAGLAQQLTERRA
ncbi:phosphatidylcholine/phosphatidylserine synthase [Paracoccus sp. P2]|uniref:Phosphatidylcholine synthase n=1 Tax=Paracoccus pantotrophus TaxID=82367 RepID=A0A1I5HD97_PARPN|nr:CDP-alcohol phosphatidyltransferase family protein [Paracoccus pantotrophus]MDF3853564.1 CDP-alcohol phosphatidyltransferase family protein [Paracoccus pantotrophus]QFG37923.1 phosphatidylcholine synthase [Paracoccus pantotrophus]QLH15477.1 CDP-alcohol phosphatidyltransferase family protein [Paracoccus pantotrophus]RDD99194.1 phosphatidylcholine synthase [Paracoccus pantotrophus]RKS51594.1 CDP-diacylglycerol-choline O-phosphatidyltransferase [Paracoccus pantotrophus]